MQTTEIEATKKEPLYQDAIRLVVDNQKSNISFIQQSLGIGYNHAARLLEAMEHNGLLAPMDRTGNRKILMTPNAELRREP